MMTNGLFSNERKGLIALFALLDALEPSLSAGKSTELSRMIKENPAIINTQIYRVVRPNGTEKVISYPLGPKNKAG